MIRSRGSLALRLVAAVLATQLVVALCWFAAWTYLSHEKSYADVAADTAHGHVAASIRSGPDVAIVPTPGLEAYAARRPSLAYAVFLRGHPLPGSSQSIVEAIAARGPALVQGVMTLGDARANAAVRRVDGVGVVVVVSTGNEFRIDDLPAYLRVLFPRVLAILGPAVLACALVLPWMIRRALHPLRNAARAAARIGIGTLDQRLSEAGVAAEIAPFVSAINQLLGRLQREVSRQSLFVANAAHELRTPVAILCARLDAMRDDDTVRALRRDAARLALLVEQLLAASRLQEASGEAPGPGGDVVDLRQLLRELIADMAPLALRNGRAIAFDSPLRSAPVHGQADGLRSAFANLLDNAVRAEPAGGSVEVRLEAHGDGWEAWVVDHGRGVADADRDSIFEPFWRGGAQWTGSGLGLAITRRIVEAHAGTLGYRTTEGGGATFVVRLPRGESVAG